MEQLFAKDFIGKTKTQKIIDQVEQNYKELFMKKYPNYFETNHSKMCSIVTALEKNEIKYIGMSKIDDLLSDNWGLFFSALFNPIGSLGGFFKDIGGAETFNFYTTTTASEVFNTTDVSIGSVVRVGSGITPATRQDINIETLLQQLTSGNGGYNSGLGKIDIPATATATFTNSISETALFGQWRAVSAPARQYLISRDLISPVVPVSSGQTINVDYQLLLS